MYHINERVIVGDATSEIEQGENGSRVCTGIIEGLRYETLDK